MNVFFKKNITAHELALKLSLELHGNEDQVISSICSVEDLKSHALKFSTLPMEETINGVVIGPSSLKAETLLISNNPRLHFCKALNYMLDNGYLERSELPSRHHPSAYVAPSAVIEDGVIIGENCIIEHNVVVHRGTSIGKNCIVRSNSVLGAQGFGFQQDLDETWVRFPQLGRLTIEDNVEIGALNSVCLGAINDTVICSGVKTDNCVHIAHNCIIGKNSILTASAELSGGVKLGKNVWIGPNSSITEKVIIGDDALVGIGSVVRKNVEPASVVAGSPAKYIGQRFK